MTYTEMLSLRKGLNCQLFIGQISNSRTTFLTFLLDAIHLSIIMTP